MLILMHKQVQDLIKIKIFPLYLCKTTNSYFPVAGMKI